MGPRMTGTLGAGVGPSPALRWVAEDREEAWVHCCFLLAIWERRSANQRIRCYEIRAEIEGKIALLRETSFKEHVPNLKLLCDRLATI